MFLFKKIHIAILMEHQHENNWKDMQIKGKIERMNDV